MVVQPLLVGVDHGLVACLGDNLAERDGLVCDLLPGKARVQQVLGLKIIGHWIGDGVLTQL